jgi:RTX calcium-binding nonapeptide repeat (4 copies)
MGNEKVSLASGLHAQVTCQPLITLSGNSTDDVLVGTEQGERITGNGGQDVLRGRGGSDCLFSGSSYRRAED